MELEDLVPGDARRREIEAELRALQATGGGVVLGRAAAVLLRDDPRVLRVLLDRPAGGADRAGAWRSRASTAPTAARRLERTDRARLAYHQTLYCVDPRAPTLYHLIIDSTRDPAGDLRRPDRGRGRRVSRACDPQGRSCSRPSTSSQDELVELLQALIRIPTINPPGEGYEDFVHELRARLDALGYATEVHIVPEDDLPTLAPLGQGLPRPNLLGDAQQRRRPDRPPQRPLRRRPGRQRLDHATRSAASCDDGCDLRPRRRRHEVRPRRAGHRRRGACAARSWAGTIVQSAVPDEETVGVRNAGMGWLVEQGLLANADALIITEPFGPDGVGIGHKGAIWGEITLHGKQAHGSSAAAGRQRRRGDGALPGRDRHATLRPLLDDARHRATASRRTSRTRRSPSTRSAAARRPTSSPTAARSPSTAGCVPGEDLDEARERAARAARSPRPAATTTARPTRPSRRWWARTSPWSRRRAAPSAALGLEPRILISAGSDDQRFVVHNAGITNSLVYGPGTTGLSHISDERISVEDLVLGTKGLALILADLHGGAHD